MRVILPFLLLAALLPAQDSRNTQIPNTDTHFTMPVYKTREAWEARRAALKAQISTALGLDPLPTRTPLHPRIFDRIVTRDCTIEKVLIETLPGYYLGGNLYRPLNSSGKHPAILNPHGHWQYGRLENQPLYSGPTLGANLARQGYVVFAWDMVGYNDTVQTPHSFGSPVAQLWAFGPAGLQIWNSLRALDFVSALDDVDPARLGMTGASGGATQTFLTAALDDRVKFFAPVNMISAIMQGGDVCENMPGLRYQTNNVEIAAMMAPRPLLMVSATGDWTRNNPSEEVPAIRRIYDLYGAGQNVENVHLDAPHNYNRQNREFVYRFFAKHILKDAEAGQITERTTEVPMLQSMLATHGQPLPAGAATFEQVAALWRKRSQTADLKRVLATEWPAEVTATATHLSRPAIGDQIPYHAREGQGTPALIIGGSLKDAPAGRPALAIDVFQTGAAVAPRERGAKHFSAFNLSDDQCRVQDILTALAWLTKKYPGQTPEVIAVDTAAAVWAGFAAKVAPIAMKLTGDASAFKGTDDDYLRYFNVPGIRLALPQ